MVITAVYDHEARKKSYSLLADAFGPEKGGGLTSSANLSTSCPAMTELMATRKRRRGQSCFSLNVARKG